MLVTHILGDCPGCGGKKSYGNVSVRGDHILRGCGYCPHSETIPLPPIHKKIAYLDQFFYGHAFRRKDQRFVEAADRIQRLASMQLMVVPYSSVHEDEANQWRGHSGRDRNELVDFIKKTSRGHEFVPQYEVERKQIMRAFQRFLDGEAVGCLIEEADAFRNSPHQWDDYLWVDVQGYHGDIERIREIKRKSVQELVDAFRLWRVSGTTFEQDVEFEIQEGARSYIQLFLQYAERIAKGDYNALTDSPINSQTILSLLELIPNNIDDKEKFSTIMDFFKSQHFREIPYQNISARIFAALRRQVKNGAYKNKNKALRKLHGIFYDIMQIATYGPYCDAFLMDKAMANLVWEPGVELKAKYGLKVFSLANWDRMFEWFDEIEKGVSDEHRAAVELAYP